MARIFVVGALLLGCAGVASALVLACDPVHDDMISALGDEAVGVRKGPLHRPGQPCTLCHDGALGSPPAFSVAGTVYVNETGSSPAVNAVVEMTTASGQTHQATTNAAGNFYLAPTEFTPDYPMKVSVTVGGVMVKMVSEIGRSGSCAGCHVQPAGPTSPGQIFIPADGGTP